jgi:hypothetical protein
MAGPFSGRDLGVSICKALGIDAGATRSVDIHIAADEIVTATIVQMVDDVQNAEVSKVLKAYKWEEDK